MYRLGCIPSHPDKLGLGHYANIIGAPKSGDVPLGPALDQADSSTCTCNAAMVAIQARMPRKADGSFAPLGSRLFAYYGSGALEGDTTDTGRQIADVFTALARLGFPEEQFWPFSDNPTKINTHPNYTAYYAAADQRVITGAHRITTRGNQRIENVKAAIAAGHPVVWGTALDDAFMNLGASDVWPGLRGPSIGGHAMVLHRYDGAILWSRSSWTDGYADGGSARVHQDAVASSDASDFWVVETAPQFSILRAA